MCVFVSVAMRPQIALVNAFELTAPGELTERPHDVLWLCLAVMDHMACYGYV